MLYRLDIYKDLFKVYSIIRIHVFVNIYSLRNNHRELCPVEARPTNCPLAVNLYASQLHILFHYLNIFLSISCKFTMKLLKMKPKWKIYVISFAIRLHYFTEWNLFKAQSNNSEYFLVIFRVITRTICSHLFNVK